MRKELGVAMALLVAAAPMAAAGTDDARRAGRKDAPRLMKDAVTTGTVEPAAFAAIADWILHEKEEKVAAGLIDVLGAVEPEIAGPGLPMAGREPDAPLAGASGERWTGTTRAIFSLFAGVLRDAQQNRRPDGRELDAEIAALVKVATPAVAGALREIDPAERARIAALVTALGPLAEDLTPLLGADLTAAARDALEKVEDK